MSIFGFITRDFWRKLAALFFAVMIYWNVNEHLKEEKKIVGVPVEVHLTQDLVMPAVRNFTASVRVRGTPRALKELDSNSITGQVDVTSENRRPDGSYRVHLSAGNFRHPIGVKVIAVDSDPELTLQLQRRISRELPVAMRFGGTLSGMYRISEQRCIPSLVMVSGPENVISELKEIPTEPIPLGDRDSGFEYEVRLVPPAQTNAAPEQVTVQIGIERNVVQRDFPAIPVGLFCDSGQGTEVGFSPETPPTAAVSVSGPSTLITVFKPDDLRLYVDVSNVSTPGVYNLPVKCHIRRSGIDVRSITPAEFKISINKTTIKK